VVVIEPSESGLPFRSAVNCAQLATIQQAGPESRLRPPAGEKELRPIGTLGPERMTAVDQALRHNLSLG
jgi:mRNA-degrading endonuclease toxin of MazEF toxin-antitoxin module